MPSPFDVRTIKELIGLMSRHDMSEIDLREGTLRIRLRRGPAGGVTVATTPMIAPLSAALAPAPAPAAPAAASAAAADKSKSGKELIPIKSPTPGTFYVASSPGAEPFVRKGSRVTATTPVCIIEAMKILNEITADCTGVIAEILVENQQPVEFGQVLFKVDPAG